MCGMGIREWTLVDIYYQYLIPMIAVESIYLNGGEG